MRLPWPAATVPAKGLTSIFHENRPNLERSRRAITGRNLPAMGWKPTSVDFGRFSLGVASILGPFHEISRLRGGNFPQGADHFIFPSDAVSGGMRSTRAGPDFVPLNGTIQ